MDDNGFTFFSSVASPNYANYNPNGRVTTSLNEHLNTLVVDAAYVTSLNLNMTMNEEIINVGGPTADHKDVSVI